MNDHSTGGKDKRVEPGTAARLPSSAPQPVDSPARTKDLLQAAPKLELPKGGGAIRGIGEKFQANPLTGSASLSVPIAVSPGRGGMTPSLSLSYDSGAGNGVFGIGWSMSMPMIQRKTDKGLPQYTDEHDVFVMSDAEDLVPVGGSETRHESSVTYSVQRYRPRVESANALIERWTNTADKTAVHWRTRTAKNMLRKYGSSSESRISKPGMALKTFCWYLDEERDEVGNILQYVWEDTSRDEPSTLMAEAGQTSTNRYLKRIRYANKSPDVASTWLIEVVFDYGDHATDEIAADPSVPRRQDPYSRFKSGFDIRCTRLCRRVLVFHRFDTVTPSNDGIPAVLTRITSFDYDENPVATTLTSVTHTGRDPDENDVSLPSVTFSYVQASQASTPTYLTGMEDLPNGVNFSHSQWVDLDGEGLSGLLTESGGAWFYKRNNGEGQLAPYRRLPSRPSPALGAGQLVDIDGDGRLEMVVRAPGINGYFTRTNDDGWEAFRRLPSSIPAADADPRSKRLDIDGDGLPDVLMPAAGGFVWYQSLGKNGWALGGESPRSNDEEQGPVVLYQNDQESVFLGDMSGDGLVDVVRVRNGSICYWPNLGYGRFGPIIRMSGAPRFDTNDRFDPTRVRLVDIDGAGPADLVYLGPKSVRWWPNESGNGFGSENTIDVPVERPITISFSDIRGDGTQCLVWASPLGRDRLAPLRYVRLMKDGKPYLLKVVDNGLGRKTTLTYTPSTKFYTDDRRAGSPWATRINFPVQCLSQIEIVDGVTGWRLVSTYTYHHGCFDGVEREFRGFGRVDQRDAESVTGGTEFDQPPVLTRTWFHTGAWKDGGTLETAFRGEWFPDDVIELDPCTMPAGLTSFDRVRESFRALKGRPLRVEVYAEDGSADEDKPYLITTTNYTVVTVDDSVDARHGIFRVDARETLSQNRERLESSSDDIRVGHQLVLEVDTYGNVTRSAQVAYGRPSGDTEQTTPVVVIATNDVVNDTVAWDEVTYASPVSHWHLGVPTRARAYHLVGSAPSYAAPVTISGLNTSYGSASTVDWDASASSGDLRRLSDQVVSYEVDETEVFLSSAADLIDSSGNVRLFAFQTYRRAFTANQVTSSVAFNSNIDSADLGNGGYVQISSDTGWWAPSGTVTRDSAHFYLPTMSMDPFGSETTITYDARFMFPTSIEDALGNIFTATMDYHYLTPNIVEDPNGNQTQVAFDGLGRVTKLALVGAANEGDTLSAPTEKYTYDLDRWVTDTEPARVRVEKRETHADSGTRWLDRYDYSDGGGTVIHSKVMAEPAASTPTTPRWVGTGRIVVDNKGNVIKQYEPFFSANSDFEFESDLASSGVSNNVVYDPLGRPIQVDLANGTRRRVSFTPWSSTTWDENDCSTDSGLTADSALLARASAHAATPSTVKLDAQGRAYKTEELLTTSTTLTTKLTLDVTGNPTAVIDAINVTTQSQSFDMLGRPIQTDSPDAGETIAFLDVAGQPQEAWRSGALSMRYTYDALRRRTHMYATEGGTERLKERNLYGEFSGAPSTGYYKGRLYRQYDTAGVVTSTGYDFKGNPLGSERVFWLTVANEIDWATLTGTSVSAIATQASSLLESTSYTTSQTYDALNRAVAQTTPDASVTTYGYNDAGLLESVTADLQGTASTDFIDNIDYNARGQRETVEYANGVTTTYEYDVDNFRLTRLHSVRASDGEDVQDLLYTYDPVGNITNIENNAEDDLFFDNTLISPDQAFEYDALYRLITATGREQAGASQPTATDPAYGPLPATDDPQNYIEEYTYDAVGNIVEFVHKVDSMVSWRRKYRYEGQGTGTTPGTQTSNRLTNTTIVGSSSTWYTYDDDARGSIVNMPHLYQNGSNPNIVPDFRDQMKQAILNSSNDALYFFDAGGQRVRKVLRTSGSVTEERLYLGATWELFRTWSGSTLDTRRETLHIMDDQRRVVVIDRLTDHDTETTPQTVQRFQLDNHLGTSCVELDENADIITNEEYHPYGSTAWWSDPGSTVSKKRYRYTGKEKDEESGLYYHGARYYASWLGSWTRADPAGMGDGTNRFRYARNNPIRYGDPTGLAADDEAPSRAPNAQEQAYLFDVQVHVDSQYGEYLDPAKRSVDLADVITIHTDPNDAGVYQAARNAAEHEADADIRQAGTSTVGMANLLAQLDLPNGGADASAADVAQAFQAHQGAIRSKLTMGHQSQLFEFIQGAADPARDQKGYVGGFYDYGAGEIHIFAFQGESAEQIADTAGHEYFHLLASADLQIALGTDDARLSFINEGVTEYLSDKISQAVGRKEDPRYLLGPESYSGKWMPQMTPIAQGTSGYTAQTSFIRGVVDPNSGTLTEAALISAYFRGGALAPNVAGTLSAAYGRLPR